MTTINRFVISTLTNRHLFMSIFIIMFSIFSLGMSFSAQAETIITNTAIANYSINGTSKTISDSAQLTKDDTVTPTDDITLQKHSNVSEAYTGDTITYTLQVGNPNSSTLHNINIQDTLPPGIQYQSGSITLNNTQISDDQVQFSGNQLLITIGDMPAKTTWTIAYKAIAIAEGKHTNQAFALSDTANSPKATATVNIAVRMIPLVLNKQANKETAKRGDVISYSLSINNPNNATINNAIIQDILPNNLIYIENSAKLNNMPIKPGNSKGLTFSVGNIPANTTWTVTYQTKVDLNSPIGELINKATVTTDDTNANSNEASSSVEVIDYKIGITKVADKETIFIGDTITYTVIVNNPETLTLSDFYIEDILPAGFTYIPNSATIDNSLLSSSDIKVNGSQIKFTIGDLEKSSTKSLRYEVKATKDAKLGNAVNTASVKSDKVESGVVKATATVTVRPLNMIPLVLNKQANKETVKRGDVISYSLSINNPNNATINNAVIQDFLPNDLIYIENSAKLNNMPIKPGNSKGLTFLVGNIPANTTWTVTYQAKVNLDSPIGKLINKAKVIADDTNANSNEASSSIEVINYKIGITKVADKETIFIGDTITYTVIVDNPETLTLSGLVIEDILPTGFVYIPSSATIDKSLLSSSGIKVNGSQIKFTIGDLAKSSTSSLSYKVKATKDAKPGDAVNTASVKSDKGESEVVSATVKLRTRSTIEFLKIDNINSGTKTVIPPTSYNDNQNGGKHWQEVNSVTLPDGSVINLPSPHHVVATEEYSISEPIVIQVTDLDQNTDPDKVETIIITINVPGTNDTEVLLLNETGPNTGLFRGIILTTQDTTQAQNGVLSLNQNSRISVTYRDEEDTTDISATAALITPDLPLNLTKEADKQTATIGELVRYTLNFKNTSNYGIPNIVLNDTLPQGFKVITDSITVNGQKVAQKTYNGQKLSLNLGLMKVSEQWKIEYLAKITANAQIGEATNSAQIASETSKSNIARATVLIKDDLMRSKNLLSGRVYIGCKTDKNIKPLKNTKIFLETGRNVLSDKDGFWHMEGVNPGKHVLQLDIESLPAGYEPILCYENTRYAKDPKSRFVDLHAGSLWRVDFHVKKVKDIDTATTKIKKKITAKPAALFGKKYLESASNEFEILWPRNNYVPSVASTKIYIKSSPQHRVELFLNGKKVSPLNYDGSDTNKSRTATIRRWFGVDIDINRRNNKLLAILKNKSGKEIARKTHNIHFSSKPASVEFLEKESILIADGKTVPVITLRIKDEDGYPMRANTHGYFTIKNGRFSVKTQNTDDDRVNQNNSSSGNHKYFIEEGGIAHIELNPTTQSGEINLEVKFTDRKSKTITAWLKPKLREWILVGIAEGTASYKNINNNLKSLNNSKQNELYKQGRIAFFAKGQIQGKYLLTMAYDSHKQKHETGYQLNGNVDPDAWYTVYADNSRSQYEAPSSRKLYVKIEKDTFFALFGDYRTGMDVTELAKFERTLNGIKSEYKGKNLSYNAFISETSNNHHHNEIPGDGTSGLYHLKQSIIPNSETIRIETRDRFHSERILETRELVRYQDYNIDYGDGTLFFKFPITGRNANFDPNIIVVDYDTESDSNKNIIAGGRIAATTDDKKLEVGVSTIQLTKKNTNNDSLIAIDATYKITSDTKIHAEIAQSKTAASQNQSANAQILELEHSIANLEAKIFYRKQGDNYGIDSQASELGTKKIGAEAKYKIDDKTNINAELSKQNNLSNNNQRQHAEVSINHRFDRFEINSGLRHSKEQLNNKSTSNNTALLGGSYTSENGKVTLRGKIEKNLNNANESEQSPDRVLVGADIKLEQGLTLFAEHEITDNNNIQTQNSRVGISKNLWKGAKAKTTITQEKTAQGQKNHATLGLSQRIKVTDKIKADISLDHAKTIGANTIRFNENEPQAQGTQRDDYSAFSVGLSSNDKIWNWTTRTEVRVGDQNDKANFQAGLVRHFENGKNLSAKINYTDSRNTDGSFSKNLKISLGSAWHPREEDFIFFNRLDLIDEKSLDDNSNTHTQKIVHNLHYNHKLNEKTQISIHHGIKQVIDENTSTTNNKENTRSTIDTATIELRRDINKSWDIGAHAGYLHDWTDKNIKKVAGVSVGVTPAENAWLQLGYNFEGFDDNDFDGSDYKHQGAYISFSYKFNQDTFRRKKKKMTNKKP